MDTNLNFKVIQGTCGFMDESLVKCGRFYPSSIKETTDRLKYYSTRTDFGCLEIDSTCYSIPSVSTVKKWVDSTPEGFIFHFKIFGIFCYNGIEIKNIPKEIRSQLPSYASNNNNNNNNNNTWIKYDSIPTEYQNQLWEEYNNAIYPAYINNKLGCIVFQFLTTFIPSSKSRSYIEYCAAHLNPHYKMAIEFRSRLWLNHENIESTLHFLRNVRPEGIALIASDDLEHEMKQNNSINITPKVNQILNVLPTYLSMKSCVDYMYIRVHRRQGSNRLLTESEIDNWVNRIQRAVQEAQIESKLISSTNTSTNTKDNVASSNDSKNICVGNSIISCSSSSNTNISDCRNTTIETTTSTNILHSFKPIYFLWATDFEDQPVINAKNLYLKLPVSLQFNWKSYIQTCNINFRQVTDKSNNIFKYFKIKDTTVTSINDNNTNNSIDSNNNKDTNKDIKENNNSNTNFTANTSNIIISCDTNTTNGNNGNINNLNSNSISTYEKLTSKRNIALLASSDGNSTAVCSSNKRIIIDITNSPTHDTDTTTVTNSSKNSINNNSNIKNKSDNKTKTIDSFFNKIV